MFPARHAVLGMCLALCASQSLGCGSDEAGGEPTGERGDTGTVLQGLGFVASSFGFFYPEPGAPFEGFDLDGRASSADAPAPDECAHDDFTGPNDEPGIDYGFLEIINDESTREDGKYVFGGFREGQLVDGVIDGATRNGSMTILIQVLGLDDPVDDDEVTVQVFASEDSPALGTDNSVLSGASLSVHPDEAYRTGEISGSVVGGVLTAGPMDLRFPIDIMIVKDELLIRDSWIRLRLDDRGFEGTLAGYWDVANIRSIIGVPTTDNGNAANFTIEQFDEAMAAFADGGYDAESDTCTSFSTMFQVKGTRAFLVSEAGPTGAGGEGGSDVGGGDVPTLLDQCVNDADQAAVADVMAGGQTGPAAVGVIAGECPTTACGTEVGAVLTDTSDRARNALGDCIAQCISDRTGLSMQCTACYGSIAACSTAFCVAPCVADASSEECANCALENCIDVNACTGFY